MASRANLVPVPVTDKNGKNTTVYRKAQRVSPTSSIPAPQFAAQVDTEHLAMSALDRVKEFYGGMKSGEGSAPANLRALAKASPEVLKELVDQIESAGEIERGVWYFFLVRGRYDPEATSYYGDEKVDLEGGELHRRHMMVYPVTSRIAAHDSAFAPSSVVASSFDKAAEFIAYDYGKNNANLRAAAIVFTMQQVNANGDDRPPARHGTESADIKYISENIDAVERVLDEIITRRTTDPDIIKNLIDAHAVLAEGGL